MAAISPIILFNRVLDAGIALAVLADAVGVGFVLFALIVAIEIKRSENLRAHGSSLAQTSAFPCHIAPETPQFAATCAICFFVAPVYKVC